MDVNEIVEQNSRTLAYLEAKDYANAITSSSSASSHLRAIQTLHGQAQNISNGTLDQCMLLYPHPFDIDADLDIDRTFTYEYGIVMSRRFTDQEILIPIVIFNAALARHLSVEKMPGTPKSIQELQRAKRLYELAYESHSASHNLLFRFATINNIALIEKRLGNNEQSERYIRQLTSVLMLFIDQKRNAELRQVSGFLVNVLDSSGTANAA